MSVALCTPPGLFWSADYDRVARSQGYTVQAHWGHQCMEIVCLWTSGRYRVRRSRVITFVAVQAVFGACPVASHALRIEYASYWNHYLPEMGA
jgi:hypothetical protein